MDTAVSPELRAYAERARTIPSLLAHALRDDPRALDRVDPPALARQCVLSPGPSGSG